MNPLWNEIEQTPAVKLAIEAQKTLEVGREFSWMPGWLQAILLFKEPLKMIEALSMAVLLQATEERLKEKVQAKTLSRDGA